MVSYDEDDESQGTSKHTRSLLAEVEVLVAQRRGRGLVLSSVDIERVRRWQTRGAPDHVVLRAIREAYEQHRGEPQRSLKFAEERVERAIERYARLQIGAHPESEPEAQGRAPSNRRLEALARARRDATEARVGTLLAQAAAALEHLEEPVWQRWRQVRAQLLVGLEEALTDAERADLEVEVQGKERYPMSEQALAAHQRALREAWLARRFGLQYLLE